MATNQRIHGNKSTYPWQQINVSMVTNQRIQGNK